jgi:hypothetical protein
MQNLVERGILLPGKAINLHILSQELKGAKPCEALLVNSYSSKGFRGKKLGFL